MLGLICAAGLTAAGGPAGPALVFGPRAKPDAVSPALRTVLLESLADAGAASAVITSTARTPEDQARAMFNNLARRERPLPVSIALQYKLYKAPGDAVVAVFERLTSGLDSVAAQARRAVIEKAMTAEIRAQGPTRVSNHCADPDKLSVADVAWSSLPDMEARRRFIEAARARTPIVLEEPYNAAIHVAAPGSDRPDKGKMVPPPRIERGTSRSTI